MTYLDQAPPFVMAHRGFSLQGLENSMTAFEAAVHLGVRYLETDVHATADGELVAFHDERLDRVTDRRGLLAQLPWRSVSQARIGGSEPIPLLADVLTSWPDVRVNIDVKAISAAGPLADVLARTNAYDRVCIASFSDRRRRATVAPLPRTVATSPGMATVAAFWAGLRLGPAGRQARRRALAGFECLQVPRRHGPMVVDRRFVETAHELGTQVHVWTVNDAATMRELLDLGVDALITDRSDIALDVLAAR